ncbi:MAG: urease accessory protein UreD [Rhodococcus sp. (in: high G+C Gram-positive bacteria)]
MSEALTLDLSFTAAGTRTVMNRRRYRWPQTVGRVFYLDVADPGHGTVLIQNAGASLHPGDYVKQRISASGGARIDVSGQGAMLVTGVPGAGPAVEETDLRAGASTGLAYRPEPRILTEFAHVEQNTSVVLKAGASVVLTDAVIVHPDVTEESFGSFRSRVTVSTTGDIRMFDAQHATTLPSPHSGLRAFATVYLLVGDENAVSSNASFDWPNGLEGLNGFDGRSGAYAAGTALPNGVGYAIRIAAAGGETLRRALETAVGLFRATEHVYPVDTS